VSARFLYRSVVSTDLFSTVEQTAGLSFLKALEKEREYPVAYPQCNDYTDNTDQVIPKQKSPCHLNSK